MAKPPPTTTPPPEPKKQVTIDDKNGTIVCTFSPAVLTPASYTSMTYMAGGTIKISREGLSSPNSSVFEVGVDGKLSIGGDKANGHISVRDSADNKTVMVDGQTGHVTIGGNQANGLLSLFDSENNETVAVYGNSGTMRLGGSGAHGSIALKDKSNNLRILVDGEKGDIVLPNADCAEEFDIASQESVEPGAVMVLDVNGTLRPCRLPYDRKVAGVISGAGEFRPAIILDRQEVPGHRAPIAMFGKVYCKVDAGLGPIEVGDLLTTSPTVGHAMKATDAARAFGAVIGKALRAHSEGCGLIPILVVMQ